jgi:anti-anti-sigma factor
MTDARFVLTPAAGGHPPRVAVCGDIDLANVAEFSDALSRAMDSAPALTVDLSEVAYCDSAAVRALFELAAATELTMVVGPSSQIRTLLAISGLDRVATVVAGR